MFKKKIFLAAAFMGALTFAGLGSASTAKADICYGGGFGGYGGGYGYGAPVYDYGYRGFRGYPSRNVSFYRSSFRSPGFGYAPYGYRNRGVSFRIGF